MLSLAVLATALTAAVAVVNGQNTTTIPGSISATCAAYLSSLNTDTVLSSCIQPLLAAASAFSPSSSSSSSSQTVLSNTLTTLCSTTPCSDTIIRSNLANFYSACLPELTASNSTAGTNAAAYAEVRQFYDVLYVVNPLREAVCSKDNTTGQWCVEEIAHDNLAANGNGTAVLVNAAIAGATDQSKAIALAQDYLYVSAPSTTLKKRQSTAATNASVPLSTPSPLANDTSVLPNSTTYGSTNLPFLFLLPTLPSSLLCTSCTRTLLTLYIKWESAVPYALGLANSPILGGQAALWNGVTNTCGSGFTGGVEQGAGTVLGGSLSAAGPRLDMEWVRGVLGVLAGVGAAVVAL